MNDSVVIVKDIRSIISFPMHPKAPFLVIVLSTMVPAAVGDDGSSFPMATKLSDSTQLEEYQKPIHFIRRLQSGSGFLQNDDDNMGDFIILLIFALFVLALAFPVNVITCCQSFQQSILQCCCCIKPPRDTPPSEVDIIDEPTSDYKLVTQISSTSMSTCNEVDMVIVTDGA